ncbi:MAG: Hint domain-containing protein [Pseudomonadota bacterium]
MPTTFTDQFWLIDPFSPPPVGTTLVPVSLAVTDQNDNGLINRFSNDSIDGSDITASYPGDTVTVNVAGVGNVTITGTTFYLADGRQVFTPTDGSGLPTGDLVSTSFVTTQNSTPTTNFGPPCFVAGTKIEMTKGMCAVEDLQEGDAIVGYDGTALPLRKILCRRFGSRELRANPKLLPIRISAGALGHGVPQRDLVVSRQHRMLIRSNIAERMFGQREVLVPAIKLIDLPGIYVDESVSEVAYFHLLFDAHEVIYAEGAPTESLFTGPEALKAVSPEAREEILTIFPEAAEMDYAPDPARFIPPNAKQKQLVARHLKNGKPLLHTLQ